jgi:phosphoribosyl 1,2-cyclic phosphodiesterase
MSADQPGVIVRFWGARGSIPVSDANVAKAGGDTACVELRHAGQILLLDAGTGLRSAGEMLVSEGARQFHLFLSHWHYDHVMGLPFFRPLMLPDVKCTLWAPKLQAVSSAAVLAQLMGPPFFPISPHMFKATMDYRDFDAGDVLAPCAAFTVRTALLSHPGGAVGYRIECAGRVIVYMTDTAHRPGTDNELARALAADADLLIYDCMYSDEEFARHGGYGHSTWNEGVRICRSSGVARLALFHHAPDRSDEALFQIEREAQALFPSCFAARQGMSLKL